MLSVTPLGAGGAAYYIEKVAKGAEDYYLGRGEPPAHWVGAGIVEFALSGRVEEADFRALLAGVHLTTGETLAQRNRTRPGFDLCFKAPKSVSLLFGLGDPKVAGAVVAAHEEAVEAALRWFEAETAWSRRGRNGVERVATAGFIGAAFRHRTSRAGDPHLHTHVVVMNLVKGTDGKWRTLDSNAMHYIAKAAGYLYQAHLRAALTDILGVEWGPVVNGYADVAGIDEELRKGFSKRREEIEVEMEARGLVSARGADVVALATRRAKEYGVDAATLRSGWWEEAQALGFTPEAFAAALGRVGARELPSVEALEALARRLSGPAGLTEEVSAFTHHDVVMAFAEAARSGATVDEVVARAEAYLARPELRQLPGHSRKFCAPFHSTAEMLALERATLRAVAARRDEGAGVVRDEIVNAVLARRASLSFEQVVMVDRLTTSGHGVEAVVAKGGTGKTFTLDACREAWEASGRAVLGCASSAEAARQLQAGSGIPSSTIAALLWDLDGEHGGALPKDCVLVVDEAGTVGTRVLARLFAHAERAKAKVVLVGDHHQLPEIEAGGMMRAIEARFEVIALEANRRQRRAWEQAALADLRNGLVADAVAAYEAKGRVVRGESAIAVREAMVADWWAARMAGDDAVMLAARRADVDDLNARARLRMGEAGRLSGPELVVHDRPYQRGDEVMTLRNAMARLGVINGTRGTVTAVDPAAGTLSLRTTDGRDVTLPRWYLDADHVAHAYARTTHKAQGMTTEYAFVLGTDDLYREMAYTAMSRGKEANRLYVVGGREPDPDGSHGERSLPEPDEVVFAAMERSRAKSLAVEELHATPARRLKALHAERRRLAPVVAGAPPDPDAEREALAEAHQRALVRLDQAESALAEASRGRRRRTSPQRTWALANVEEARRRLAEVGAEMAALPSRARERQSYLARHRDELERATAVEGAIESALRRRVDEVEAFRPPYLVDVIGEPPADPEARRTWRAAARLIENQRAALGVDDEGSVLGRGPTSDDDPAMWQAARHDMQTAKTLVRLIPRSRRGLEVPERELDRGIGREL